MKPVRQKPSSDPAAEARSDRLVLARFGAPHGVRGEVRLKSYTEIPMAVADYGPLEADNGRRFRLTRARPAASAAADMLVVAVDGIADRTAAETLNGLELSVPRSRLPETDKDDFYHTDLIGLTAETEAGEPLGAVAAIHNHGAGDLLEIVGPDGTPILVPFTKEIVPIVDIAGGRLVVDPPLGLLDRGDTEKDAQ